MGHELVSRSVRRLAVAGAVAVAAGTASVANAAVELGEGVSVTGFVDMSYYSFNPDVGATTKGFGIDQVEMDFLYSGSNGVSAQVDIEYGESSAGDPDDDTTFVEQAFITKAFGESGFSVKLGRFLSYSGWETEEPTGLFQYSGTGYAPLFYGYYQQGVSAMYSSEKFAVMGSVVNDVFGYAGGPLERDTDDLGFEVGAAVMPIEGLTAKVFYMDDKKTDRKVINAWASYAIAGFTFAGEYNDGDYGAAGDANGFLVMGNYAKGNLGATVRYHQVKYNGDKSSAITLSPSYKVGDKLLLVAEYRMDNFEGSDDAKSIALEALFMF
jgi:hypothetical protein